MAGPESLRSIAPSHSRLLPIRAPTRRTTPSSPIPEAVKLFCSNMFPPACRPSARRAEPESLRSLAPVQSRVPPMWASSRRNAQDLACPMILTPPRKSPLHISAGVQ